MYFMVVFVLSLSVNDSSTIYDMPTLFGIIQKLKNFISGSLPKCQNDVLTLCVWQAREVDNADLPRPTAGEKS